MLPARSNPDREMLVTCEAESQRIPGQLQGSEVPLAPRHGVPPFKLRSTDLRSATASEEQSW
jgi:hypothetical protein